MNNLASLSFKIISQDTPEYLAAVALRENILSKPLGLTFQPHELDQEKEHLHIIGIKDSEIVATSVLIPEGENCKMQRVVKTRSTQFNH